MKLYQEVKNETIAWVKAKVQDLYDEYTHYKCVELDRIKAEFYKHEMALTLTTYALLVNGCDDFVNLYLELFSSDECPLNEDMFKRWYR